MIQAAVAILISCSAMSNGDRQCVANVYHNPAISVQACQAKVEILADTMYAALRKYGAINVETIGACYDDLVVPQHLDSYMTERLGSKKNTIRHYEGF